MAAPPLGGSGRVQVQPCGPIAPEKWNVEMAGGTQTISQSAVDFCLDLNGGDTTNGNLVQPCGPIAPEKWNVEMAGGTQTISQSAVDFCLDLNGGDTTNGNFVQVWECNGLPNQQWVFADGTFQ